MYSICGLLENTYVSVYSMGYTIMPYNIPKNPSKHIMELDWVEVAAEAAASSEICYCRFWHDEAGCYLLSHETASQNLRMMTWQTCRVMLAMGPILELTIPWLLFEWTKPICKHEKLPCM